MLNHAALGSGLNVKETWPLEISYIMKANTLSTLVEMERDNLVNSYKNHFLTEKSLPDNDLLCYG